MQTFRATRKLQFRAFHTPAAICLPGARFQRRRTAAKQPVRAASRVRLGPAVPERGQNLIEFAMLTPFILVFIGALVVFGIALNARSSLQQAVREGARQAAVGATLAQVQDLASGNAPEQIVPADVKWCHPVGTSGTQGQVGDPVRVYLFKGGSEGYEYTLVSLGGIFNAFGVGPLKVRMSPRATARLEKSVASPVDCP